MRPILRNRGAPPPTIDDALQTAAERALLRREVFDTLQGWINWTVKVAWHEVQAEWKRNARSVLGDPDDTPAGPDPATIVERRTELTAVIRGVRALAPPERRAIVDGIEDGLLTGPLAAKEKMRRYRARRHLAALVAEWDRS